MARLCMFCLIFFEIMVVQVVAHTSDGSVVNSIEGNGRNGAETYEAMARVEDQIAPTSGAEELSSEYGSAEAPGIRQLGQHHSSDKSIAGAGVIVGGLVTAIFAAVFAYIRVTRKRNVHTSSLV